VAPQKLDDSEEIAFMFLHPGELNAEIDTGAFSQALHVSSYYRGLQALSQQRATQR
jgi:hypothetical protein